MHHRLERPAGFVTRLIIISKKRKFPLNATRLTQLNAVAPNRPRLLVLFKCSDPLRGLLPC